MAEQHEIDDVREVLDCVEHAGEGKGVAVSDIVDEIGSDAFGPLLLVPALILVSPISGVPGMPTIGSLIISLIAIQIALGRDSLWLPGFIRRREMSKERLQKAISWLRNPARWIDRLTRKRLVFLTERPFSILPALLCSSMVLFAPAFETLPFSVSLFAGAVALFALALVAKDGLAVILALAVAAAAVAATHRLLW